MKFLTSIFYLRYSKWVPPWAAHSKERWTTEKIDFLISFRSQFFKILIHFFFNSTKLVGCFPSNIGEHLWFGFFGILFGIFGMQNFIQNTEKIGIFTRIDHTVGWILAMTYTQTLYETPSKVVFSALITPNKFRSLAPFYFFIAWQVFWNIEVSSTRFLVLCEMTMFFKYRKKVYKEEVETVIIQIVSLIKESQTDWFRWRPVPQFYIPVLKRWIY